MDGIELGVRSTHAVAGTPIATSDPIGYVVEAPGGSTVAAIESNGFSNRHMLLPRNRADRVAAAAALLTLALFRHPGDTG